MKKYLFGLGAMLVGAGLMFVLMHGEVSAESDVSTLVPIDETECKLVLLKQGQIKTKQFRVVSYCNIKDLTCVFNGESMSCVKKGLFK